MKTCPKCGDTLPAKVYGPGPKCWFCVQGIRVGPSRKPGGRPAKEKKAP